MEQPSKYTDLAEKAGISLSYASEILGGQRVPSRPLAIHIYRKTGWRHSIIADLTAKQIDTLEAVDPWVAPKDRTPAKPESAAA